MENEWQRAGIIGIHAFPGKRTVGGEASNPIAGDRTAVVRIFDLKYVAFAIAGHEHDLARIDELVLAVDARRIIGFGFVAETQNDPARPQGAGIAREIGVLGIGRERRRRAWYRPGSGVGRLLCDRAGRIGGLLRDRACGIGRALPDRISGIRALLGYPAGRVSGLPGERCRWQRRWLSPCTLKRQDSQDSQDGR